MTEPFRLQLPSAPERRRVEHAGPHLHGLGSSDARCNRRIDVQALGVVVTRSLTFKRTSPITAAHPFAAGSTFRNHLSTRRTVPLLERLWVHTRFNMCSRALVAA
jgi:hypothetical protein